MPTAYHFYFGSPLNAGIILIVIMLFFLPAFAENAKYQVVQSNPFLRYIHINDGIQTGMFGAGIIIGVIGLVFGGIIQLVIFDESKQKMTLTYHTMMEIYASAVIYMLIPVIFLWTVQGSMLKAKSIVKKENNKKIQALENIITTSMSHVYKYDCSSGITRIEVMEIINKLDMAKTKIQVEKIKRGTLQQYTEAKDALNEIERVEIGQAMKRFNNILSKEREIALYLSRYSTDEKQAIRELVHSDVISAYERMIQDKETKRKIG